MPNEKTTSTAGYVHVCELAVGGMGSVALAVKGAGSFRRMCAIKRLHPHLQDDRAYRDMFLDEAKVAGLIRHANVVSVLDVDEDEQGPFLVMDYIDGVSLSEIIQYFECANENAPIQLALEIMAQSARGLHAAHEVRNHRGDAIELVHRDVSPPNILLGFDGTVRLTDFGIAKAEGNRSSTSGAVLKGKISYMSPEQLGSKKLDRRSDLFSLGVVIFELLSGERLYKEEELLTVAKRIIEDPPPDIGDHRMDIPPALAELLFELLSKDPNLRPPTAQDVALRAEQLLADESSIHGRMALSEWLEPRFAERRSRRRARIENELSRVTEVLTRNRRGRFDPKLLALAAAAVIVAGASSAWWWSRAPTTPTPEPGSANIAVRDASTNRLPSPFAIAPAATDRTQKGSENQAAPDTNAAQPATAEPVPPGKKKATPPRRTRSKPVRRSTRRRPKVEKKKPTDDEKLWDWDKP